MDEKENLENIQKCPHFDSCSQNLCPLDFDLKLKRNSNQDKCRWMRETKNTKIAGREFISGGQAMPNAILNFVPSENLMRLNQSSKTRWFEIKGLSPK